MNQRTPLQADGYGTGSAAEPKASDGSLSSSPQSGGESIPTRLNLNQKKDKPMSNTIDTMIDPNDNVLLLIDHQSELFQLVRDIELPVLRANATPMRGMCRAEKTLQE